MKTPTISQALRDLLATIELHTDCMDNHIDREALEPYIEKAEAALAQFEAMTDEVKTEILKASLLNIGRLLPPGTEVQFYREDGDPRARMHLCYADGTNIEFAFIGHSPVFDVSVTPPGAQEEAAA